MSRDKKEFSGERFAKNIIFYLFVFIVSLNGTTGLTAKLKQYTIKKGDTPAQVAKRFRITTEELLRFNNIKPGDGFRIGRQLSIPRPGEVTGTQYTVKNGDSVAKIADFHGVSQKDLRAVNGLKPGDFVRAGQVLSIPYELRGGALQGHVVRQGDSLVSIAKKHRVSIKMLAVTNKLSPGDRLQIGRTLIIPEDDEDVDKPRRPAKVSKLAKTGKKVAGGVMHEVQPGQSLWIIARAYNTTGERIIQANGMEPQTSIRVGQQILIPGAKEVVPVRLKGFASQKIRFVSIWNDARVHLRLMNKRGRVIPHSRRQLSKLAGSKFKTRRTKLLHPRLIHMLQRVAERFPGHTIEIVSGYRPRRRGQRVSKHNQGKALDFRVRGVSNTELYNYIKNLPRVGAGYYPNSVFVHMDVRTRKTTWTDYSGPGEAAQYERGAPADPEAAADAEKSAPPPPPNPLGQGAVAADAPEPVDGDRP